MGRDDPGKEKGSPAWCGQIWFRKDIDFPKTVLASPCLEKPRGTQLHPPFETTVWGNWRWRGRWRRRAWEATGLLMVPVRLGRGDGRCRPTVLPRTADTEMPCKVKQERDP